MKSCFSLTRPETNPRDSLTLRGCDEAALDKNHGEEERGEREARRRKNKG